MTVYGTPGGTPLVTPPFQGTTPGNAAGATLPGIPPNMSVLAAVSAGLLPVNALATNFGQKHHNGPPGTTPAGRTVIDCIEDVDQSGTGAAFVANGGSPNLNAGGGAGPGAGQLNQTQAPCAGEIAILPQNAPGNAAAAVQLPNNTQNGGVAPTLGSPVQYGG